MRGGRGTRLPSWGGAIQAGTANSRQRCHCQLCPGRCFSTTFLCGATLHATPCVGTPKEGTNVPDKGYAGGAQVSWSGGANALKCFWGELHEQQGCLCRDPWLPALILSELRYSFVSMGFWSTLSGGQGAGHIEEPLSSEGGTWPESLCSHKMSFPELEEPWRVSDNVWQPSCAISTPVPPCIPLPRGRFPLGWVVAPAPCAAFTS